MNLKAGNTGHSSFPPFQSAYVTPLPGYGSNRRIMFYENNDYYFPIIVSLIVLPANNVTKAKIARSILAAESAKKLHTIYLNNKIDMTTG